MQKSKKQIVENYIRKIVKEEQSYDVNSTQNKLFNLSAFFKSMYEYTKNKEGNLDIDFVIKSLEKQIALLKRK